MKKSLLLLNFLLLACAEESITNHYSPQFPCRAKELLDYRIKKTKVSITPLRVIPESFELDSIFFCDNLLNYDVFVIFPLSLSDNVFNERIAEFIHEQINLERRNKNYNWYTSFNMWIKEFDAKETCIRLKFTTQSINEERAHYTEWSAIMNYNPLDGSYESLITDIDLR